MAHRPIADARTGKPHVVIIGGGFSGAAFAIHLAQRMMTPARVTIVEPRATVGTGLAYSTHDPAHRVNVPARMMSVFPDMPLHFETWLRSSGWLAADPDMAAPRGLFPLRSTFGRYVAEALREVAGGPVAIQHVMDSARTIGCGDGGWSVGLMGDCPPLAADVVAIATGHPRPTVPAGVDGGLRGSPRLVTDPWSERALAGIGDCDAVGVIGTGLTMADVVASLEMRGHRGLITAISRHGLLPRNHTETEVPAWGEFASHTPPSAACVLRRARGAIRQAAEAGLPWQAVMQGLHRDAQATWIALAHGEKRRFLRHLRAFWDVHRYRLSPQVSALLRRRLANGTLETIAGTVRDVSEAGQRVAIGLKPRGASTAECLRREVDTMILATGPAHGRMVPSNPLLASAAAQGLLSPDPLGLGIAVDRFSRCIAATGRPDPRLVVLGPPARGTFGELVGVPEIVAQAASVAAQVADLMGATQAGRGRSDGA